MAYVISDACILVELVKELAQQEQSAKEMDST